VPFTTNAELPERIRQRLPQPAQDIFRAAFNAAYFRYGPNQEARAFRIAWAAVKQGYAHRAASLWVRRPQSRIRCTTSRNGCG
jgi:cation transport regulator